MKVQKFVIFVKKNHAKFTKYCKIKDHCHYIEEYGGAAHSICGLKYNALKIFLQFFTTDLIMIIILS